MTDVLEPTGSKDGGAAGYAPAGEAWLTVEQTAELLGVTKGRVHQLIKAKNGKPPRIPSILVGHIRQIAKRDALAYKPITGPTGGRPRGYSPGKRVPDEVQNVATRRGSPMVPLG